LKGQAHRSRRGYSGSIVQIGKALLQAKHYLSHGLFVRWVEDEVGLPARTAQAYMQVAQWLQAKSVAVALLPPSVLYLLSAPSAPEALVADIISKDRRRRADFAGSIRAELKELRDKRSTEHSLTNKQIVGETEPGPTRCYVGGSILLVNARARPVRVGGTHRRCPRGL
jgi:hypothetical protein